MADTDWREQLPAKVRTLQIVIGALSFGCLPLLVIAIFVSQNANNAVDQPMLTYIALAMAGMILGVWTFLPGVIVSQGRKEIQRKLLSPTEKASDKSADDKVEKEKSKAQGLFGLFQTKTIIAGALLEGAVFLLLIAYLVEHNIFSILAAVAMLLLLTAHIPTIGRVTNWIENQMRLVDEERAFG